MNWHPVAPPLSPHSTTCRILTPFMAGLSHSWPESLPSTLVTRSRFDLLQLSPFRSTRYYLANNHILTTRINGSTPSTGYIGFAFRISFKELKKMDFFWVLQWREIWLFANCELDFYLQIVIQCWTHLITRLKKVPAFSSPSKPA